MSSGKPFVRLTRFWEDFFGRLKWLEVIEPRHFGGPGPAEIYARLQNQTIGGAGHLVCHEKTLAVVFLQAATAATVQQSKIIM